MKILSQINPKLIVIGMEEKKRFQNSELEDFCAVLTVSENRILSDNMTWDLSASKGNENKYKDGLTNELSQDNLACLQLYTSGTTGPSKCTII